MVVGGGVGGGGVGGGGGGKVKGVGEGSFGLSRSLKSSGGMKNSGEFSVG